MTLHILLETIAVSKLVVSGQVYQGGIVLMMLGDVIRQVNIDGGCGTQVRSTAQAQLDIHLLRATIASCTSSR